MLCHVIRGTIIAAAARAIPTAEDDYDLFSFNSAIISSNAFPV
jgi:hypothetical protein